MKPCLTGCVTFAVAAAFGALPIPASFENNPRFTPSKIAAPSPPPTTSLIPKACKKISLNTYGIAVMFVTTTNNATAT
ncbi:Uncharacterised protein [Streptococcus pneumoniae]|nr:Uncharacterised protein [Streptococcus pneumoniae]